MAQRGPRRGFWYQVWRPFRAVGRGIAGFLETWELVAALVNLGRGVFWLLRGAVRIVARLGDW